MLPRLGSTRKAFGRGVSVGIRVGRATSYVAVASACLALLGARVVYGDAREATVRLGKTLDGFGDLTSETTTVSLNGATLHISTMFTDESVDAVLDRYEQDCSANPGVLGEMIHEMLPKAGPRFELPRAFGFGVVRQHDEGGGMVVCFARNGGQSLIPAKERIHAFLTTHDLSKLGDLRYVIAERTDDGRSRVRTIWSEGSVPVDRMFPASGDAPGGDSVLAGRPPSSRRTLAAAALGMPYGVHVYQSTMSANEARSFYDAELARRGFERAPGDGGAQGNAYTREDGAMVMVAVGQGETSTSISVVDATGALSTAEPRQ